MFSFSPLLLVTAIVSAFAAPTDLVPRNGPTQLIERTEPGTGPSGGYYYSYYNSGSDSSVTFTAGAGGEYGVSWTNCDNFVAGKGWETGSAR